MMPDQWTISPLCLGTASVDKSVTLLYRDPGVKEEGPVLAWLLKHENTKILVDTGPFSPEKTMDELFTRTPEQTMEAQLRRFDTSPDEITMIINTHLHTDHCTGNAYFKNVQGLVQTKEIEYAKDPLPVHRPAYDVELEGIEFQLLDGDTEVASGLQVILVPGHSPGSQAVLVHTSQGLYVIAGDNIPCFENMEVPDNEPFWPNGLYVDLNEYYRSLGRLKALGGFILPGHDFSVLNKAVYP
jgi:N-acyl homoserine lactone hydrolase